MSRQSDTHKGHPSNEYYSIYVDFSFSSQLLSFCCKLGSAGIQKRSLHLDSFACLLGTHSFVCLWPLVCVLNRVCSSLPRGYVQQVVEIRGLKMHGPCRYVVLHQVPKILRSIGFTWILGIQEFYQDIEISRFYSQYKQSFTFFCLQGFLMEHCSGIPEFRSFGQKGNFSAFGFWFRPPKVKAEYGRNSRKVLDFFFPSVFQDGLVFLIHFWQSIFASTLTFEIVHY